MNKELSVAFEKMLDPKLKKLGVISWGTPIISFGNLKNAKVATIGLNPSNREFVDINGRELKGPERRFHTLNSLRINNWNEINNSHYKLIIESCFQYFLRNPYDTWFKKLDYLISGTRSSYYFPSGIACHLDLIPFATFKKWTELAPSQRKYLLELSSDLLGLLLKKSNVNTLILNGITVVKSLQNVSNIEFEKIHKGDWTLSRKDSNGVNGFAFTGEVDIIGNISLGRSIRVLGYNHNIQSSFGVTKIVQTSIRNWISETSTRHEAARY